MEQPNMTEIILDKVLGLTDKNLQMQNQFIRELTELKNSIANHKKDLDILDGKIKDILDMMRSTSNSSCLSNIAAPNTADRLLALNLPINGTLISLSFISRSIPSKPCSMIFVLKSAKLLSE